MLNNLYKPLPSTHKAMPRRRSIIGIILSKLLGLVVFLVILLVVNMLAFFIGNPAFIRAVQLVNMNIWLLISISIILFVGELFGVLLFPFNLPAPLFNALGAVFLLRFIYRVFEFIESITMEGIFSLFKWFSFLIYPLVFIIVLVGGYVGIFARALRQGREQEGPHKPRTARKRKERHSKDE